ncbi:MAG: tRNA dimethylallyltransferase [Parcubacteria group bacterium GW2011_GWF2_39_13b]|nr:MAG: tRNA dimethylallyltransferase [Parcubacteria group bacterium GW2011_GWF2_39_13b]
MDIGSGKITKKEMKGVPHYLLDVASPKKKFTVAQFQKLALIAIKKIKNKNKIPILCGGTGLYIHQLLMV